MIEMLVLMLIIWGTACAIVGIFQWALYMLGGEYRRDLHRRATRKRRAEMAYTERVTRAILENKHH